MRVEKTAIDSTASVQVIVWDGQVAGIASYSYSYSYLRMVKIYRPGYRVTRAI